MKKLGLVLATATVFCLAVAAPALAQYPPEVEGTSGGSGGGGATGGGGGAAGTAFTGADVSLWMVLLVAFAVAGVTALILSRRKKAAASK
jgi:LPXTG-motif cell wall-anchored protein